MRYTHFQYLFRRLAYSPYTHRAVFVLKITKNKYCKLFTLRKHMSTMSILLSCSVGYRDLCPPYQVYPSGG